MQTYILNITNQQESFMINRERVKIIEWQINKKMILIKKISSN